MYGSYVWEDTEEQTNCTYGSYAWEDTEDGLIVRMAVMCGKTPWNGLIVRMAVMCGKTPRNGLIVCMEVMCGKTARNGLIVCMAVNVWEDTKDRTNQETSKDLDEFHAVFTRQCFFFVCVLRWQSNIQGTLGVFLEVISAETTI